MNQLPDWVRRRTLPAESPVDIRAAVTNDLMDTVRADHGLFHSAAVCGDEIIMRQMMPLGKTDRVDFTRSFDGRRAAELMELRPTTFTTFNSFRVYTLEELQDNIIMESLWTPANIHSNISMSVMRDGSFAGWIGAFRIDDEPAFTAEERRRLAPRIAAYIHALDMARRLEGDGPSGRALALMNERGEVTYACASGTQLMKNDTLRTQIGDTLSKTGHSASFTVGDFLVRVTPVAGESGRLFVVDMVALQRWRVPALVQMSLQKRRVAELVALGATVDEIGRSLDLSPWTVRTYLRQIYEALGVASRVELAEAVWNITDPMDAVAPA
jgi:DNA-binding CsgD family transcriptional regulator